MTESDNHGHEARSGAWPTATRWTLLLQARDSDSPQAHAALDQLCRIYRKPVLVFIRSRGFSPEDAEDVTQDFFSDLLSRNDLQKVSAEKGSFRDFLLAAVRHFLSNHRDRLAARKRGGGQLHISIDDASEGNALAGELISPLPTPEQEYHRTWAAALLNTVFIKLQGEYAAKGKAQMFEALHSTLTADDPPLGYVEVARQLGTTEGALKVFVHRLRRRYGQLLRAEIAETVRPEDVDNEIRSLLSALGP